MSNLDPNKAIGNLVVAEFTDGRVRDIGTAIGYSVDPSYEIKRADGSRFSSLARLVREITPAEEAAYWRQRAEAAEAKLDADDPTTERVVSIAKPVEWNATMEHLARTMDRFVDGGFRSGGAA